MESVIESPLDVLSRAATMVQRDPPLHAGPSPGAAARGPPADAPAEEGRPPPLPRCAGDVRRAPQQRPSTAAAAQLYLLVPLSVRASSSRRGAFPVTGSRDEDGGSPLDMRRQPPPPPPPPPPPQQFLRPSVITCAPGRCPPSPPRPHGAQASSGSGDDPDIDEHFRRSLGSDYAHLFSSGGARLWPPMTTTPPNNSSLTIKITGNSVDDHFAKALGETWRKLQEAEEQDKGGGEEGDKATPPPLVTTMGPWSPPPAVAASAADAEGHHPSQPCQAGGNACTVRRETT